MNELTIPPALDTPQDFELGKMLGRRETFGTIAGRCSAAEAEALRRLHDEKLYLSGATTWEEFCPKFLGFSARHANRTIRRLKELGPSYFELAQLARITPEQFRAIAPAVRDGQIHAGGEAIALVPENSERIAEAVANLRRDSETESSMDDLLAAIDRRANRLVADCQKLADEKPRGLPKILLRTVMLETITALRLVEVRLGI